MWSKWILEYLQKARTLGKSDQRGVATTEYAIMLVLIALAVAGMGGNTGVDDAVVGVFVDLAAILTS